MPRGLEQGAFTARQVEQRLGGLHVFRRDVEGAAGGVRLRVGLVGNDHNDRAPIERFVRA